MRRTYGTEPLDDTIVTYAWDEGQFAQVEAYANSLPRAQPQAQNKNRWRADCRRGITDDTSAPTAISAPRSARHWARARTSSPSAPPSGTTVRPTRPPAAPVRQPWPQPRRCWCLGGAKLVAQPRALHSKRFIDENLRCGLYLSQRNTLIAALDPRCTRIHVRVLAAIPRPHELQDCWDRLFLGLRHHCARCGGLASWASVPPVDGYEPKYFCRHRLQPASVGLPRLSAARARGRRPGAGALHGGSPIGSKHLQREVTEFVNKIRTRDRLNALLAERAGVTNAHDAGKSNL